MASAKLSPACLLHTFASTAFPERSPTLTSPLWLLQLPPGHMWQALTERSTIQSKGSMIAGHYIDFLRAGHVKHRSKNSNGASLLFCMFTGITASKAYFELSYVLFGIVHLATHCRQALCLEILHTLT